ncbi:UTRA domain-containing protein [Gottfriedia acidiceleris]|uniref:UTRA domain-containing protein n=1 Tax=Gottfriedia acidiceleris TaxID=371036 RepID=UPI003D1FAF0E
MIPNSRILRSEVIPAPKDVAEHLKVEEGSRVLELERLMYVNDRPLFYDIAHYSLIRFLIWKRKLQLMNPHIKFSQRTTIQKS